MSKSIEKTNSKPYSVLTIIGLFLLGLGVLIMVFAIRVEINIIDLENELYVPNMPRPIIDPPAFAWAGIMSAYLGWILSLWGGLKYKNPVFSVPLIFLGTVFLAEIVILKIILLYSPYHYENNEFLAKIIMDIFLALPGIICLFEGIYLRKFAKKQIKGSI